MENSEYEFIAKSGKYKKVINGNNYYYIKLNCVNCNKELFRPSDYLKKHKYPTCDQQCYNEYANKDIIVNEDGYIINEDGKYRKKVGEYWVYHYKTECLTCKKVLYRRCADYYDGVKNFCDDKPCEKEYNQKNGNYITYQVGKEYKVDDNTIRVFNGNSWSYKKKFICTTCGKEVWREDYKQGELSFCSKWCNYKYTDLKGSDILNKVDDNNFYYLLGMIATDGCVYGNSVNVGLQKSDGYLLESFKNYFGGKYYEYENNEQAKWLITNVKFTEYLISIGITEKKSLTLNINNWFNTLDDIKKQYFIRGTIDGDGSVGYYSSDNKLFISFCSGSEEFMKIVQSYFNADKKYYIVKPREDKYSEHNSYQYMLTGKKALKAIQKLYNGFKVDIDLGLKRKYDKIKDVLTMEDTLIMEDSEELDYII